MNGKSIVMGSLAAALCATACIALLYWLPGGQVGPNQWVILVTSTSAGASTAYFLRSRSPRESALLRWLWPAGVLCGGAVVIGAALAVPYPAAKTLAHDITELLPHDCEKFTADWPDQPGPGDFRRLEWKLKKAEHHMRQINQQIDVFGLYRESQWALVDVELNNAAFASIRAPTPKTGAIPVDRKEQYHLIKARLDRASQALVSEAKKTKLPSVIRWAEKIQKSVAQLCVTSN